MTNIKEKFFTFKTGQGGGIDPLYDPLQNPDTCKHNYTAGVSMKKVEMVAYNGKIRQVPQIDTMGAICRICRYYKPFN